ncbi:MAG: cupin domain-containing protein [Gammaproteobacteria bacterium]|nr:cupin domain-containing protein [Gammaproteobacteria bacterium]
MKSDEQRLTIGYALAKLKHEDSTYEKIFRHGSLHVEIYRPEREDPQTKHSLDELYVVISGNGFFVRGDERQPFEPGEVIFVPAGMDHRFEEFSDDFATWVFFYGPEGGEQETWFI